MSQCLRSIPVKFQSTSSSVLTQLPLVFSGKPNKIPNDGYTSTRSPASISSQLTNIDILRRTRNMTMHERIIHLSTLQKQVLKLSQIQPKIKPEQGPNWNEPKSQSESKSQKDQDLDGKPPADKFLHVYNVLQDNLPKFFTKPMDYQIYNENVLFVNNHLNKTTAGLLKYVQQVALLRIIGHLKFAYVKFHVLNMSHDIKEGRITVRWRIVGLSGLRVMLKFWKYRLWKWQEIMKQQETWYDGVSYFDVGSDGKVYRHIADKVMPDKDAVVDEKIVKAPITAKLAVLAALFPQPENLGDAIAFQCEEPTTSTLSDLLLTSFF